MIKKFMVTGGDFLVCIINKYTWGVIQDSAKLLTEQCMEIQWEQIGS